VFENVAMPDVAEFVTGIDLGSARQVEADYYARDVSRVGFDGVFPGGAFVRLGGHGDAGEKQFAGLQVGFGIEGLAIQDLELD
jgi:hypothetical protein